MAMTAGERKSSSTVTCRVFTLLLKMVSLAALPMNVASERKAVRNCLYSFLVITLIRILWQQ